MAEGSDWMPRYLLKPIYIVACKYCESCIRNLQTDEYYCAECDGREIRLRRGESKPTWRPKNAEWTERKEE